MDYARSGSTSTLTVVLDAGRFKLMCSITVTVYPYSSNICMFDPWLSDCISDIVLPRYVQYNPNYPDTNYRDKFIYAQKAHVFHVFPS